MNAPAAPRRGSLLAVFLTVFIDLLGFGMLIPLVAIYARELLEGRPNAGMIVGLLACSYSVMQFLFSPIWGRISDRVGRRPILLMGLLGSTVCYACFGWATSEKDLTLMFASRILAGIFGATIPTAAAYIADTTTKENRTKGMALIGAAFGLGFTFGPVLAGLAIMFSGGNSLSPWPGYAASLLSAFAFAYAFFKLPESLRPNSQHGPRKLFDVPALKTALSIPSVFGLLMTAFVANLAFSNMEAISAYIMYVPTDKGGFGIELATVTFLYAGVGFTHALGQGAIRSLSKRMSDAKLALIGTSSSLIGLALSAVGVLQESFPLVAAGLMTGAISFAFIPAPVQAMISRRSNPAEQGAILGVNQSLGSLARIIGHGICYSLFHWMAASPFYIGAALMGVAILLLVVNANKGKDYADEPDFPAEPGPAVNDK